MAIVRKKVGISDIIIYTAVVLISLACFLPFVYVVSVSLTDPDAYIPYTFYFFPSKLSFQVYRYILSTSAFINALKSTVYITLLGTSLNIVVTFFMAYGLTKKDLPLRRFFLGLVIFALLFNAGIIPNYMLVKELGLINKYWSCILPVLTNSWSVIVAKSFLDNLPDELEEAAQIDGCSFFGIFFRIIVPLSMASVATLTLFFAVGHWNVYFKPLMYLTDHKKRTLQVYVKTLLVDGMTQGEGSAVGGLEDRTIPSETVRLATVVLAMLPILIVYPFVQRYFIKGVMLGSIKG